MTEDATPLVGGAFGDHRRRADLFAAGGLDKDEFITRVLEAIDNPRINAALAAHGHPVSGT